MDVSRGPCRRLSPAGLGLLCFLFVACGSPTANTSSPDSKLNKSSGICAATATAQDYVVQWKDGSITQEHAISEAALVRDVIAPNNNKIAFAEHDQIIRIRKPVGVKLESSMPSAAPNWGQKRVSAPAAWAQGIQGEGVVVAVVDTGVDLSHPQLAGQIYTNPNEVLNGIDDDANGYIDDIHGWDFDANTNLVTDVAGHGTHVAGIIAADHVNGEVLGMAPKAKIMPLRFMDASGSGQLSNAIKAMTYAAANGAKIVNASWGSEACSAAMQAAVTALSDKGVLFISAAGNGDSWGRGVNLDTSPIYPAAFAIGTQISVGASTDSEFMAGFSNFSGSKVHLMAPGVDIFSTYPSSSTTYLDGTSMATPFVAGAAALIWSQYPHATASQVRNALFGSVDVYNYPVLTHGRLNAAAAVTKLGELLR